MTRVLVAEDEEPLRDAIADLINSEADLSVVATARSADEVATLAEQLRPDVAVVDVRMPGGGPEAARCIRERAPDTSIVALSAYEDHASVVDMIVAGASAYLVKGVAPAEIVDAIRRAARGQASISVDVISRAIEELAARRFRALLESVPDAVVVADERGAIVLANEETERLFGYERTRLVGRPLELLLPASLGVERFGRRTELELNARRSDGTEFPVDASLSAVRTDEGALTLAFIRDVSERIAAEEARRRGDERFATLIESAPDAVVIFDSDDRIVLVNRQTEELFGYKREDLLGVSIERVLPERRRLGGGLDLAGRRSDGSEFPVDVSLSTISTDGGLLVTAFVRDISERREAEAAARQLAALVESSDDAIVGEGLGGTIQSWNRAAERIYGYAPEEAIGRSIDILVPADRRDELRETMERLTRGDEIQPFETKRVRKDGRVIDVSLRVSAIRDASGRLVGASKIARDITHAKAQAGREREHAERRQLLAHLVAVAEEERSRIAADIHDDSIQAITAAGMRLQILRKSLEDPAQLLLLDELEQTIQMSIARLRHLLFELRPPVLDNEGLSAAVEMYLSEAERESDTRYRLDDELSSQPPPETRTILYRIIQEALTNVRKHAQASSATVILRERAGGYSARVVDDGVGFADAAARAQPGHLGLASMRERATLAGGWLRIDAVPDKGTSVEAWIPQEPEPHASPTEESAEGGVTSRA